MESPRIIIVDSDLEYIAPIQLKFIEEFFDRIQLEIITEKTYFDTLFSSPQTMDILILPEDFYDDAVRRHNIGHIFLMTEQPENPQEDGPLITKLYKYTSVKEIFNEITGECREILKNCEETQKEPEVILVFSANGGSGKTTVALGVCSCMAKNYKKALYISASYLHTFQRMLTDQTPVSSADVYSSFIRGKETLYQEIRHTIRKEQFYYIPPFKTALLSLGSSFSIYIKMILQAKNSNDYDYIVVDTDSIFHDSAAELLNIASKVIVVTNPSEHSVFATNILVSNLNGGNSDKFIFICNDVQDEGKETVPETKPDFTVSEYVDHMNDYGQLKAKDLGSSDGIQKTTLLII